MKNNLKLTWPMMHGPVVKRLQEFGDLLGFDYGINDGIFGNDTERVVIDIQKKYGLIVDGICGPKTWGKIYSEVSGLPYSNIEKSGVGIVDIRGKHKRPKLYSHERKWSEIVGVTLHQTGCNMPDNPSGWKRLNAHCGVLQSGKAVIVNDPVDMIYHAQGLSWGTIGIEFEGNYYGVEGNEKTLWRGGGGPHHLNLNMKLAADELFEVLRTEFVRNGAEWNHIYAHRQSSKSRRGDPGSEIWQNIAMVWAKRLGLNDYDGGQFFKKKHGMVIPKQWNSDYSGRY